jgi:hypothetical protein
MNTEEIITGLRYVATKRPLECILYVSAADALETLQKELSQAIAERTPHDYGILKEEAQEMRRQRDQARAEVERHKEAHAKCRQYLATALDKLENQRTETTRPEPSRLEIAAKLMAAHVYHLGMMYPEGLTLRQACLIEADELIAAAREAK